MPDICDLILDEHALFRRRFAELDEQHDAGPKTLGPLWQILAELLERHAAAEEEILYPRLLHRGRDAEDETDDALRDHNKIRDAVRDAADLEPGSERWWHAVGRAREENSDHMAEEEREALADFRRNTAKDERLRLGIAFLSYSTRHAGAAGLDHTDVDADRYIRENG